MFTSKFLARLVAIVIVLMLALGGIPSASAAGTMTVTLLSTNLNLTNRLLVTVPVVIVCDPLPGTPFEDEVSVTVQQASGQSVIHGSGSVGFSFGSSLWTCDGTTTNIVMVPVVPDTNNGPFHGGPALVSASAQYFTGDSCGDGCFTNIQAEFGSTGFVSVRLH